MIKQRVIVALLGMLMLAACDGSNGEAISPEERHKMTFSIPATLDHHVDLNDKNDVAKALGIKLTGDPKQHLYDIVMTAPSSEGKKEKRVIPIRVDNLKQGSNVIYGLEGVHKAAEKAAPKKAVAKKSTAKK